MTERTELFRVALAQRILEAREGDMSPEWKEFLAAQKSYLELSRQLNEERRLRKKSDPALVKLHSEGQAFFDDLFREWLEAGDLPIDYVPYNEKQRYIERQKQRVAATRGVK
jgi:hypothetical protein